jgi:AraC-like DNA-binding protein
MFQDCHLLQLAALFDYLDDVRAWIKDLEGRFCWVNRTTIMHFSPGDPEGRGILGKTVHEILPAYLADQYVLDDEYVLAGNHIVGRMELNLSFEGTAVWHVTNKIPLVGRDGAIIGTAGITRVLDTVGETAPATEFGAVLAYMRDNHDSSLTNAQLAKVVHMSVRAFERKFLSCFHLTPQVYVKRLRLRMASHALVYTNEPMSTVASGCGFADQSHFSREFRRHFGRTPREYRARYAHAAGPKK